MLSYVYAAAASYVRPTSTSAPGEVSAIAKTLASSQPQFASPSTSLPSTPGASTSSQSTPGPKSPTGPLSAANLSSRPPPQSVDRYAVIHDVLRHEDLYGVLGVPKSADLNAMRRAYMARCKCCHPDKFPEYPLSTLAFQKVSFAYDTLSNPSSRRAYDKNGLAAKFASSTTDRNGNYYAHHAPDDTLNAVLYGVFCDFMDGDFEMIRTFLRAMGEINSKMQMSEETIENLVNSFRKLREVLLAGRKYVTVIRFELIRMHEIQSNLRQLSYFDVRGRLRLTLQLARVTLNLPMVVDIAMREDDADSDDEDDHRGGGHSSARSRDSARRREKTRVKLGRVKGRTKRGLIPPRVGAVIGLAIGALEMGERVL